jgi:hypothetical protein
MVDRPSRTFYRILEGSLPTLRDFTSFQALGRPLRRQTPELLRRWSGISVYETEEQARSTALWRPSIGRYIAAVRIEHDAPIELEQTGDPDSGHYTLWGEPSEFVVRIVSIVPVEV